MEAPGDFSTSTNTSPTSPWMQVCCCRDGSRGADRAKHLIPLERRAESLLLEGRERKEKKKERKLGNFEPIGENEAVSLAPVSTDGREYKYLLIAWPQVDQQLTIAFRPSGSRLAPRINPSAASNDFITKKGGPWACGDCWQPRRAALQYSLAQPSPQAPLSPVVHRAHLAAPCRFPRHRLPYDRFFFCQKTLNNIDLHVLASPLLMEHASTFTSN